MTLKFFFTQSLGFLIQLFPCMSLCFMPFDKESLRVKSRVVSAVIVLFALAAASGFPFAISMPFITDADFACSIANFYMLGVVLLFVIGYAWTVRESFFKKSITLVMAVFYATTQYLLVNMFLPQFDVPSRGMMVYPPLVLLLYASSTVILFPAVAYLMHRVLRAYIKEIEPGTMRRDFAIVIAVSVFYFGTVIYYACVLGFTDSSYWWVFCPPLLFAAILLCFFYLMLFREAVLRKRESEYLRTEKVQQIQYEKLLRDMESTSRMRHDARHHYRTLYEMAVASHDDVAVAYLSSLIDQAVRRESVQFCLNPTINALLQYYIGWAQDAHICCEVRANCDKLAVSSLDLSTVIGNTLENAIQACAKVEGATFLSVEIGMVDAAQLAIRVENSCDSVQIAKARQAETGYLPAEAFLSANKTGGYGLKSIAMTVQKYNGAAEFYFDREHHTFVSRIRLQAVFVDEALCDSKESKDAVACGNKAE